MTIILCIVGCLIENEEFHIAAHAEISMLLQIIDEFRGLRSFQRAGRSTNPAEHFQRCEQEVTIAFVDRFVRWIDETQRTSSMALDQHEHEVFVRFQTERRNRRMVHFA